MEKPRITIIGLGKVGTAMLRVFTNHGYVVISAYNRTGVADTLKSEFTETTFVQDLSSLEQTIGDLIFLTVSDDSITSLSEELARQPFKWGGRMVVHCSGTYSSKSLSALKEAGAKTASFHPMQAITKSTNSFSGIWFDIEGDKEALKSLEQIAEVFGAKSFRVEAEAKPFLHASAVVASNYLVVLVDLVSKISARASISEETALKALTPLMENTLQNINDLGVTEALTGPIARGDVDTVREHLEQLKIDPEVLYLYKTFGMEAVKIAERKSGSTQSLKTIKKLLS